MDRGRKKRKFGLVGEEEEEESEESKMEKFYELIRSSKDIRARLDMIQGAKMEEKKTANESKRAGAWNPTFQLEDFMEDGLCLINITACRPLGTANKQAAGAGASNSKREDDCGRRQEGEDDGLDLNLSL